MYLVIQNDDFGKKNRKMRVLEKKNNLDLMHTIYVTLYVKCKLVTWRNVNFYFRYK